LLTNIFSNVFFTYRVSNHLPHYCYTKHVTNNSSNIFPFDFPNYWNAIHQSYHVAIYFLSYLLAEHTSYHSPTYVVTFKIPDNIITYPFPFIISFYLESNIFTIKFANDLDSNGISNKFTFIFVTINVSYKIPFIVTTNKFSDESSLNLVSNP
jgi:hypothetical protein